MEPGHKRKRDMAAPGDDELLGAIAQVKEAHPDFGMARIRAHLKDANGWELSEKRVKKVLAELAEEKRPSGNCAASNTAVSTSDGTGAASGSSGAWLAERPSPRGYFSLTALQPCETFSGIVMFGGEFFDNDKNLFYNQLYLLDVSSREWSRLNCGNAPSARSAHQACVCGGYYWVFGGEFNSPSGNKFKLMDDLWRMPVSADGSLGGKWQRVWPGGGGGMDSPGPRSGHRMLALGDKLLIYGGMGESKYYGDLHVWDVSRGVWISKAVKMQQMKLLGDKGPTPGPRGGFAMWPDGDAALYIWGGTRDKGRNESEYLADLWRLDTATWGWERVACPPSTGPGVRSGVTVSLIGADRRKALLFGGVTDVEDNVGGGGKGKMSTKMRPVFHADMHCFDMDTRTWSAPASTAPAIAVAAPTTCVAAVAAGAQGRQSPSARRNAQAVFVGGSSSLILVGGLREEKTQGGSKEKEVTLDDVWSIRLECGEGAAAVQAGAWECWKAPTGSNWHDSSEGDSDDSEGEEGGAQFAGDGDGDD